ncbi:MAG: hypothetical protein COA73_17570 [Candidatus Hydrogenedentota bacterium]|nr:MAG: hypothetical protein COA73_17570 [Candidatus Hydrogenedentota bacterium]
MGLFRKKNSSSNKTPSLPVTIGDIARKFLKSDADLVKIAGPEDGGSVCGDWVGAVVSVSGTHETWPALIEAVEDGVFHPGCRHRLEAFVPERDEAEAQFCTTLARAARNRRKGINPNTQSNVEALFSQDPSPEQMDFEKLYAAARQAESVGAVETALSKCEAALNVLHQHNLYGDQQESVEHALEARIRTVLSKRTSL